MRPSFVKIISPWEFLSKRPIGNIPFTEISEVIIPIGLLYA